MNNKHVDKECDTLDASVFSGDFLYNKENREEFQAYLGRWSRKLQSVRENELKEVKEKYNKILHALIQHADDQYLSMEDAQEAISEMIEEPWNDFIGTYYIDKFKEK